MISTLFSSDTRCEVYRGPCPGCNTPNMTSGYHKHYYCPLNAMHAHYTYLCGSVGHFSINAGENFVKIICLSQKLRGWCAILCRREKDRHCITWMSACHTESMDPRKNIRHDLAWIYEVPYDHNMELRQNVLIDLFMSLKLSSRDRSEHQSERPVGHLESTFRPS